MSAALQELKRDQEAASRFKANAVNNPLDIRPHSTHTPRSGESRPHAPGNWQSQVVRNASSVGGLGMEVSGLEDIRSLGDIAGSIGRRVSEGTRSSLKKAANLIDREIEGDLLPLQAEARRLGEKARQNVMFVAEHPKEVVGNVTKGVASAASNIGREVGSALAYVKTHPRQTAVRVLVAGAVGVGAAACAPPARAAQDISPIPITGPTDRPIPEETPTPESKQDLMREFDAQLNGFLEDNKMRFMEDGEHFNHQYNGEAVDLTNDIKRQEGFFAENSNHPIVAALGRVNMDKMSPWISNFENGAIIGVTSSKPGHLRIVRLPQVEITPEGLLSFDSREGKVTVRAINPSQTVLPASWVIGNDSFEVVAQNGYLIARAVDGHLEINPDLNPQSTDPIALISATVTPQPTELPPPPTAAALLSPTPESTPDFTKVPTSIPSSPTLQINLSSPTAKFAATESAPKSATPMRKPTDKPIPKPTLSEEQQVAQKIDFIEKTGNYNFGNKSYITTSNGIMIFTDGVNGFHDHSDGVPNILSANEIQESINWILNHPERETNPEINAAVDEIRSMFNEIGLTAIVDSSKFGHPADPDLVGKYRLIMLDHKWFGQVQSISKRKAMIVMLIGHDLGRHESQIETGNFNRKDVWFPHNDRFYQAAKKLSSDPEYTGSLDYLYNILVNQAALN